MYCQKKTCEGGYFVDTDGDCKKTEIIDPNLVDYFEEVKTIKSCKGEKVGTSVLDNYWKTVNKKLNEVT